MPAASTTQRGLIQVLDLMKRPFAIILLFLAFGSAVAQMPGQRPRPLTCPKTLTSSGALLLAFGPRHGSEFAIVRKSDGARFVLVSAKMTEDVPQVMPPENFAKTMMYQMDVDKEWFVWGGDGSSQRIFNAPGDYLILVGKDVTSDKGGYKCTVTYTG